MSGEPDLERILAHFTLFSSTIEDLPLYSRLARACAEDPDVAGLLLAARPGQARPVLLLAAVHDLVLRQPDLALGRWYSSVTPASELASGDPWPTFRETCLAHADELRQVIAAQATQTNEVNRVVLLAPLLAAACADDAQRPVSLVELGASAGLLLGLDRYRIEVGDMVVGDAASPVHLFGDLRGPGRPDLSTFPTSIVERVGIDLDPVDLGDAERMRWLQACLWPDQPWRLERFRAATEMLRVDPPRLVTGDFVDTLADVAAELAADTHLVVFDGWALTYVARERRPLVVATLAELAAHGRPVSWLTAEAPKCVPGIEPPPWIGTDEESTPDTVLGLRRWRDGVELPAAVHGWAHPHGNWMRWL